MVYKTITTAFKWKRYSTQLATQPQGSHYYDTYDTLVDEDYMHEFPTTKVAKRNRKKNDNT